MPISLQEALSDRKTLKELQENPKTFKFREDVELKVAGLPSAFIGIEPHPDKEGQLIFGRAVGELVNYFARALNFTWISVIPADGTFGSRLPNGSWTGVVELVNTGKADMGFGPLLISQERSEGVDFGDTIVFFNFKIMSGRGSPEMNPWGFLYPYTLAVWIGLLGALAGVWLASILLRDRAGMNFRNDVGIGLLYAHWAILLRQDFPWLLTRGREMLVFGSWMLLSMIITMGYSSTLVSLLTARNIPQPIQSLEHLVQSDNVVIIKPNSGSTSFLLSATSGLYKQVGDLRYVNRIAFIKSGERGEALDTLVREGHYSFYDVDFSLQDLISTDFSAKGRCDFYLSRESSLASPASLGVTPKSPILPALNYRIHSVLAAGLFNFWLSKGVVNATVCENAPTTITVMEPLSLRVCWGMFTVWGMGLVLSFVTFLIEIAADRLQGQREERLV